MSSPSNVQRWWGRRRNVPLLASFFKEKLFSCIPQLTYPYVLLVARFTNCRPQTNHCQRGWNDIAWIHPNLCPWGCRGPRSPEAHSSLIFYQNGERMSAGESTNSVCHTRKKYLEKALFKGSFVSGSDLARFVFLKFPYVLDLNDLKKKSYAVSEADFLSRPRACRIFLKSVFGFASHLWPLPLQPLLPSPPPSLPPLLLLLPPTL